MDIIPKEDQTIAVKRFRRISRKIRETRIKVFAPTGWWANKVVEVAGLVLLVGLNVYLIIPFWGNTGTSNPFSGPAIPFFAGAIRDLFTVSFPFALHLVSIFFFLLFPVADYFLIFLLTKRRLVALTSVLFATLPFLVFAKARIVAGFFGGDLPHVASLSILPLAIYWLISFLRHGGVKNLLVTAVVSAAIILTSPFGFISYCVFAVIVTFSEMLLGYGRLKFLRFGISFCAAIALTSFWYNPSFAWWMVWGPFGKEMRVVAEHLIPLSLFIVPVLGAFGFLLFDRKQHMQPMFLASFWTIVFVIIIFFGKGTFNLSVPSRYLPELGIALSFFLAVAMVWFIDALKLSQITTVPFLNRPGFSNPAITLVLVLLVTGILLFRETVPPPMEEVAAFWHTGMEREKIWLARENFDGISHAIGYIVTAATITIFALLAYRTRKNKKGRIH